MENNLWWDNTFIIILTEEKDTLNTLWQFLFLFSQIHTCTHPRAHKCMDTHTCTHTHTHACTHTLALVCTHSHSSSHTHRHTMSLILLISQCTCTVLLHSKADVSKKLLQSKVCYEYSTFTGMALFCSKTASVLMCPSHSARHSTCMAWCWWWSRARSRVSSERGCLSPTTDTGGSFSSQRSLFNIVSLLEVRGSPSRKE